jgi:hypothetical protein
MKRWLLALPVFLVTFLPLYAQNPISPPGVYLADPSARVFQDGKLYLYTSQDESCDYYCSSRYYLNSAMVTRLLSNISILMRG